MENKKKTKVTLDEASKMKGETQWAKLIAEERSANKKVQPTRKPRG